MNDRGILGDDKIADMVPLDGNPLENVAMIADRANRRYVLKGGVAVHQRPAVKVAVAAE